MTNIENITRQLAERNRLNEADIAARNQENQETIESIISGRYFERTKEQQEFLDKFEVSSRRTARAQYGALKARVASSIVLGVMDCITRGANNGNDNEVIDADFTDITDQKKLR